MTTTPHPTDPTLALVALSKGMFAVISAVDVPIVSPFKWSLSKSGTGGIYAIRSVTVRKGVRRYIALHRTIADEMGIGRSAQVDHKNGNSLDCRRSNLRAATASQNAMNRRVRGASGVKGLILCKPGTWRLAIMVRGKRHAIGTYHSIEDGRRAAIEARARLHGDFANHN